MGTVGLTQDNQLHLIDFEEDNMEITFTVFPHESEVLHLASCPQDPQLVLTGYKPQVYGETKMSLWRLSVDMNDVLHERDGEITELSCVEGQFEGLFYF